MSQLEQIITLVDTWEKRKVDRLSWDEYFMHQLELEKLQSKYITKQVCQGMIPLVFRTSKIIF